MRRPGYGKIPLFLVLLICSCFLGCARETVPVVGRPAADFTVTDLQGEKVSLSQFRGKVVIIDFWATWCPPCKASIPHLVDIYRRYNGKGVVILGILLEQSSSSHISRFVADMRINYPVLLGTQEIMETYKVRHIPVTIVVDKEGIIREKLIGFSDVTMRRLEESIRELL